MAKKLFITLFLFSLIMAVPLHAAEFPTKEVQIIIPWAAGGATDLIFRALAATTGKIPWKGGRCDQPARRGGAVGFTEAMQARPDGYTLVSAVTPLTILPIRYPRPLRTRILIRSLMLWTIHPCSNEIGCPLKSLKEFLDYAKKNPGMITVGNSGAGGESTS